MVYCVGQEFIECSLSGVQVYKNYNSILWQLIYCPRYLIHIDAFHKVMWHHDNILSWWLSLREEKKSYICNS